MKNSKIVLPIISILSLSACGNSAPSIEVVSYSIVEPDKLTYIQGEEVDMTGFKIVAQYSDDSEEEIDNKEYRYIFPDTYVLGEQPVQVLYKNQKFTFNITVKSKFTLKTFSNNVEFHTEDQLTRFINNPDVLEDNIYFSYLDGMVFSIDYSGTSEVYQYADSFVWPYGSKRVIKHESNIGLRNNILFCGIVVQQNI